MPRILAQQPRWLDRGTAGFDFFQQQLESKDRSLAVVKQADAPARRIATRGSEIFAIVGNELRWSDVESWKEFVPVKKDLTNEQKQYKVLKTPTSRPILQITVSPSGDFIAVLTSHTCHVCVLPPSEKLRSTDSQPLKLRSFQVGPTAHVLEQSPIATALWHPLAPSGNGLVTVTRDACVRLWELDSNSRNTFDEPALAVDLKKLGNATSTREDFSASKFGANKGYTLDDVEMQVAASCFGGRGRDDEDGWASMTLWVAMTEGDVYALCPFLPAQFWAPASLLPSLTTSVVAKARILEQDFQATETEKRIADQQCKWLAELDKQDPAIVPGDYGSMEVFTRPDRPGTVPKLQGPFQLSPEPDFGEITDIHVVAPQINHEALFDEEDEDYLDLEKDEGLSVGIICLATNTSQVYVCLNLEGVEAEWLPARRSRIRTFDDEEAEKELLLMETIDCASTTDQGTPSEQWPTFTESPHDRYEVLSTQPKGVFALNFRSWITGLEAELAAPQKEAEGAALRLGVMLDSASTTVHRITVEPEGARRISDATVTVYAPHTEIGYAVLTLASGTPIATILDIAPAPHAFYPEAVAQIDNTAFPQARPVYAAPEAFFQPSALTSQLDTWRKESAGGARGDLQSQIRFSPWTLQRITEAHRILSSETHDLGVAAADLYRRCQRMLDEMRDQIDSVRTLSNRIDSVTGEDNFSESVAGQPDFVRGGKERIESRIQESKQRTEELQQRVEKLRSKMRHIGGKELSAKERAFAAEVAALDQNIGSSSGLASPVRLVHMENSMLTTSTMSSFNTSASTAVEETIHARFSAIEELYKQLLEQTALLQSKLETEATRNAEDEKTPSVPGLTNDYRNRKMTQVFGMLDRETAMIEAVTDRLRRLQA